MQIFIRNVIRCFKIPSICFAKLNEFTEDRLESPKTVTSKPSDHNKPLANKDQQQQKLQEHQRFEFLDGYRGSLALLITIAHAKYNDHEQTLNLFSSYTQIYSVAGFFMLSAFLLTYRLLRAFDDEAITTINYNNNRPKRLLLAILHYLVRRFFRICIAYWVMIYMIKNGHEYLAGYARGAYASWFDILMWRSPGQNHLWTIPAEVKYYLFVPLFCLGSLAFGAYFLLFSVTWSVADQFFNIFRLTVNDVEAASPSSHRLTSHFAVFLLGSEVALAFYLIEKYQ